jgi:hypothetical protein
MDEERAFGVVGLPGDLALIAATIIFGVIFWINLRHQERGTAVSLAFGGAGGWAAWKILLEYDIIR